MLAALPLVAFALVGCKTPSQDSAVTPNAQQPQASRAAKVTELSAQELPQGYRQDTLIAQGLMPSPGQAMVLDGMEVTFVEDRHTRVEGDAQTCFLSTTVWAVKQNPDDQYTRSLLACVDQGTSQAQVLMRGGVEGNGSRLLYLKDLTQDGSPELITTRQESNSPAALSVYKILSPSALEEVTLHRPEQQGEDICLEEAFKDGAMRAWTTVCDWAEGEPSFTPQHYTYEYDEAANAFQVQSR